MVPPVDPQETYSHCDEIACPMCGYSNTYLWEHDLDDCETTRIECGGCERPFSLSKRVTITYIAREL